jgi:HSP20 family protein
MLSAWDAVSTLDQVVDDVMGSMLGTAKSPRTFDPAIDVRTSDGEVIFVCDVPGFKQEDLELTLENHVLTLKGTRRFEGKEGEQVMLGRAYGTFRRAFTLPDYLDDATLTAHLAEGVLTIRIGKLARAKPRKVTIGVGEDSKQLER